MAKKSFKRNAEETLTGGLGSIIRNTTQTPPPKVTEPAVPAPKLKKSRAPKPKAKAEKKTWKSETGCLPGDTRKTYIVRKELADKLQDIAYWEPGKLKDHVNAALEAYVKKKWTKSRPKGT